MLLTQYNDPNFILRCRCRCRYRKWQQRQEEEEEEVAVVAVHQLSLTADNIPACMLLMFSGVLHSLLGCHDIVCRVASMPCDVRDATASSMKPHGREPLLFCLAIELLDM
ncbi:hypothetical protein IV203_016305 [Nitzschia inconspicua]|uniref:Uncharacterized protein n=1 Tax=Nitzschia inconspicua TaxID=303405 RepID=A0A9K3KPS0_9STRA|nr:hypothetical protein IV203_021294 [Nitzschia inconspicua]KAG7347600.1 hypothetical protein IV203_016305 [Nitzschia inconspicua]